MQDTAMKDRAVAAMVATGNRNRLAASKSATLGGSERIYSREETAARHVGRCLAGYTRTRKELSACEEFQRPRTESALVCACVDLLECVGDMEMLHSGGKYPKLVESALRALGSNQGRLKDANPGMLGQARTLLAYMDARDYVSHIATTHDLDDVQRLQLLARALGEVSLLMEKGNDGPLVSRVLGMIIANGEPEAAKPEAKRAALAARIMQAGRSGDGVSIPKDVAAGARANLASLMADVVAAASGTGKRSRGICSQVVLNLAGAYADIVVLERARRETPQDGDRELIGAALDMIIASPPSTEKRLAAELMRGRLD